MWSNSRKSRARDVGGWEKQFPDPNLLDAQTTCAAKELIKFNIQVPIEVQSSRPKRESLILVFIQY